MSPILLTALVLALVLVVMARTNRAPDFVIWAAVALLVIVPVRDEQGWRGGVLDLGAALGGLANEGVVTIAALFIVAAGVRETGALQLLVTRVFGTPRSELGAQHRVIWPTALLSAFFNNTPLVAILVPLTDDWARRHRISVSRLLMPLSFASILGGACTLIGTSTNLIVNGWLVEFAEHPGLGMFEVTPVALPIAVAGLAFLLITSRWLLPARQPVFEQIDDLREYIVAMEIEPGSDLAGRTIDEAGLRGLPGLYLVEIERGSEILPAVSSNVRLAAGDQLVFAGIVDSVVDLQRFTGLRPATDQVLKLDQPRDNRRLIEAVVSDTCPAAGKTVRESRFRTMYNAAIIAVARNGERIRAKIGDIELRAGDTLLLEARPSFLDQQRNSRDFYLVSELESARPVVRKRAPIALALLVGVVGSVTSGMFSMLEASLAAALAMVASGCCGASVARRTIDWEVLLVIAGALALGEAMVASGLAAQLAVFVVGFAAGDAYVMLATVFVASAVLAAVITAKAGAVLMLPIALAAAASLELSFLPFAIAVMLASATSVATPIGYPTNLMVYGPGGYRFGDYLRLGGPLTVLVGALSVWLVPIVFPFTG